MKKLIVYIILISIGLGSMYGQTKKKPVAKSQTTTAVSKINSATNQPTKSGTYTYNEMSGIATYSYILKNGQEIKQGLFTFKSKLGLNGTYTVSGVYDNDIKTGNWTAVSSWSIYNGEEHVISDFIFSRVSEYRPFKEITKRQTVPWLNGRLNGKEVILFTQKESWGEYGGGQKAIVYKKEKTWKENRIQDFYFESLVNNVKKEFLKGKYATQGIYIVYDGDWSGIIDGKSLNIVYNKGVLKSVLVKNQGTEAEVLKQESYPVDTLTINKLNDKRNISVKFKDDNAKLIITKIENDQYEFEVISSQVSGSLPDNYLESLTSKINYVERSSPYDGNPEDNEWTANKSTIKKNYLSQDRNKGQLRSISADDENAVKIFEIIDEGNIEYVGSGINFFSAFNIKDWTNEKPSYFNPTMYIKYLLYKGKADKVFNLFSQAYADQSKLLDYPGYEEWNLNSVGFMPYYFVSICLTGDLNKATEIIKSNITNFIKHKDGSVETWVESATKHINDFLPFIQKAYPQDRIAFLQNVSNTCINIKCDVVKAYFDGAKTVKIGQLNWMARPLALDSIDFSVNAIDNYSYDGQSVKKVRIVLNNLQPKDYKMLEPKGWRLPTVSELKDLNARNLSDYKLSITRLYNICKDENGKLVVYDGYNDVVLIPSNKANDKVSGFCMLIKTE